MCFLAFLQISHSFLFFCRLWLSFSTTVLTAIPPVLEIMYLCVWWVSLMSSFCSSMSSITYPCVSESHFLPQSGVWVKNWTRYFLNASLSPYDRSELCFYCPTQLGGCSCFSPSLHLHLVHQMQSGVPKVTLCSKWPNENAIYVRTVLRSDGKRKQIWVLSYTHTPHAD